VAEWEHFRIAVSYRENGNVDFVAKKDRDTSSMATHGGMKAQFNITPVEWKAYLQEMQDDGWELQHVEKSTSGSGETYILKRAKT
jgi:hypothetical protein